MLRIYEGVEQSLIAEYCDDDEVPSVLIVEKRALIVLLRNTWRKINPEYHFEFSFSVNIGSNSRE